jgi:hypothetical protein
VVQGAQFADLPTTTKAPTLLVIHETVTRSAETTFRVLKRRGLSVQLVGAPDGRLIQHADLGARAQHAGTARNPISVGIEVVNPYYPRLAPSKGSPWTEAIDAPWAHEKRYLMPTREQAESCAAWIAFATAPGSPVGATREWPGLSGGFMAMGRVKAPLRRGIVAHCYFGHADGAWLVLYAWLRIVAGMDTATAYSEATRRATGVRRVDIRDLGASPPKALTAL